LEGTPSINFNATRYHSIQPDETTSTSQDIDVTADVSTGADTDYPTSSTFKVSRINQSVVAFDVVSPCYLILSLFYRSL